MTTDNTTPAAAATPPAAAQAAAPAAAAQTQQTASQSSEAPAAKPADDGDLVTGAENKPAEVKPDAPKAPETAAEKRAYLDSKTADADKEALKGKTDEEIEKLFTDEKAKEQLEAEVGDYKLENIKLPEDMPIPEEMKEKVTDLAKIFNNKELNASEKMQKAVDLHVEIQNRQLEDFKKVKDEWKGRVLADPELKAAVGPANDVVRKFAGDAKHLEEFQSTLKFLGLGNHPSFVRFCANIAKATGEDTQDGNASGGSPRKKDLAELMYPNMPSSNS